MAAMITILHQPLQYNTISINNKLTKFYIQKKNSKVVNLIRLLE